MRFGTSTGPSEIGLKTCGYLASPGCSDNASLLPQTSGTGAPTQLTCGGCCQPYDWSGDGSIPIVAFDVNRRFAGVGRAAPSGELPSCGCDATCPHPGSLVSGPDHSSRRRRPRVSPHSPPLKSVNADSLGNSTSFSPLANGGPASGEEVALGRLVRLGPEGVLGRLRALDRVRHRLRARAVENRLEVVPNVLDGQLGVRVAGRIAEVAVPDPAGAGLEVAARHGTFLVREIGNRGSNLLGVVVVLEQRQELRRIVHVRGGGGERGRTQRVDLDAVGLAFDRERVGQP